MRAGINLHVHLVAHLLPQALKKLLYSACCPIGLSGYKVSFTTCESSDMTGRFYNKQRDYSRDLSKLFVLYKDGLWTWISIAATCSTLATENDD